MHDLEPAVRELVRVVNAVHDDQLHEPTPCTRYTVGDLLEHVHGLTAAFAFAGRKQQPPGGSKPPPQGDAVLLPADWRAEISERAGELTAAWATPAAWADTTWIAGFQAPAAFVGITAVNEVVVHGWDLAQATGQVIRFDDAALAPCREFVAMMSGPGSEAMRGDAFGPALPLPPSSSTLDQVVAGNGRDPSWSR